MKELGIEKLFERHMFLLIGILLIARIFYSKSITWNLNRTIGWGWDLRTCLKIKSSYYSKRFNKIWQFAQRIHASELFVVFS